MKNKALWLSGGILGLVILIFILLPGFGKRYLVSHSEELLGRNVSIEKIRLNYFTTTLSVLGFKMFEADGNTTFISFDTLLVNFQPLNFINNELVIEQLYLSGLYTSIIQEDSTFNFDDLVDFHTAEENNKVNDTTPSKPLRFRLTNLELKQANFIFDDQNVSKTTSLRDFSLFVPFIAWNQAEKSEAGLRFNFAKEGYFESSLKIDLVAGDYQADITIERLYLQAFQEYISYYSNVDSLKGIFNSRIRLDGNINRVEESVVSGKIEILDLLLTDPQGQKFLGAGKIDISLKNIDHYHSRYEIDSAVLTEPYVHFILSDSTNNLMQIFSYPEEDTLLTAVVVDDSVSSAETGSLFYSVDALIIKNGTVDYNDNLTGEPFDYHLSDIVLNTDSISSNAGWVNLYSQMLLNERGTLKAEVGFNPADPVNNIKLDYVITGFQLSDLNIYSRFYMGFPILLGEMYYISETGITGGQLNSENKLVMTNVELGEKGGGIYDIPIKFALFILKDREGVINLDVPVRGDMNDPKVRLGKIIWNTFKNLIFKVATAPYDALAGSVNADPKDLESINFEYMDTLLTAQRQHQLDLLIELEEVKEGLGIELVYFNDAEKEKEMIALTDLSLEEEEVEKLATIFSNSRMTVLEKYLHSVNDSTQIKFSISNPGDPDNMGSKPFFRILYSLEGD